MTANDIERSRDPSTDQIGREDSDVTRPSRVVVHETMRVFDGFFQIDEAVVEYERFDGRMSGPQRRLVFERGDSVAVLPYDRDRGEVVLVKQFRYPAHVREGQGWLWELIAGMQEEGRDPEAVARSEALEEAGLRLGDLLHLTTAYLSPGGSTERIHLYLSPIAEGCRVGRGWGLAADGEDTLVRRFPVAVALAMIADGRIVDAKTVIALQWLALHEGLV